MGVQPAASGDISSVVLVLVFLLLFPSATPVTFSFTAFQSDNPNLTLQGHATASSAGAIQLTNGEPWSAGRALFSRPVRLWDATTGEVTNFSTSFSFGIKANGSNVGDGLAFFLAPSGSTMPKNSAGGFLGLFENSTEAAAASSSPRLVAVEFDTKSDEWDPPYPHVAFDVGSIRSLRVPISPWKVDLSSGSLRSFRAWVTFDSSKQNLTVKVTPTGGGSTTSVSFAPMDSIQTALPEWVNVGFSAATSEAVESHEIYSWDFSSTLKTSEEEQGTAPRPAAPRPDLQLFSSTLKTSEEEQGTAPRPAPGPDRSAGGGDGTHPGEPSMPPVVVVVIAVVVVIVVGIITCLIVTWCWKKSQVRVRERPVDPFQDIGPRKFSVGELESATDHFNEERRLGSGAFGTVYLGRWESSEHAIKCFEGERGGIKKSFEAEVRTIGRLSHRNLVPLVGWCIASPRHFFIVYDYMPNRSLDLHLFTDPHTGQMAYPLLPWERRYTVVLGLASALRYLQEDWRDCVVHRDIKSANVMLDAGFNARLGDFGLARYFEHGKSMRSTEFAGTLAYMAPEIQRRELKHNKKSDVYSFGVVVLEVATGRKASLLPTAGTGEKGVDSLVACVRIHRREGDLLGAADGRLGGKYDAEQMRLLLMVGLLCTLDDCAERPTMSEVIAYLSFKVAVPDVCPMINDDGAPQPPVASMPPSITSSVRHTGR